MEIFQHSTVQWCNLINYSVRVGRIMQANDGPGPTIVCSNSVSNDYDDAPRIYHILPRTSALCTCTEVQISLPPAGASIPTDPWLFPCTSTDKKARAFYSAQIMSNNW